MDDLDQDGTEPDDGAPGAPDPEEAEIERLQAELDEKVANEDPEAEEGEGEEQEEEREERPAPKAAAAKEPPVETRGDRTKAIREARALARQARERAERAEAALERQQGRLDTFMGRLAKHAGVDVSDLIEEEGEAPTPEKPVDFLVAKLQELINPLEKKLSAIEQRDVERQARAAAEQVDRYIDSDVQRFEADHPDYSVAEDFLTEALLTEAWNAALAKHPDHSEDEVAANVERGFGYAVAQIKLEMARKGTSFASEVYKLAQGRGYSPAGGRQPAARRQAAGGGATTGKAGELRKALMRAPATGAAGKSHGRGPITTVDELVAIPEEEFEKLTDDPKAWKKLVEGFAP
jgi:hypothetical protein